MPTAHAQEAIELLQGLLRINTVNPPGNERLAQELLAGHLRDAGLEVTMVSDDASRPNLVARLRGGRRALLGCSPTWTRSWLSRRAGATTPGRARSRGLRVGRGALDMKARRRPRR